MANEVSRVRLSGEGPGRWWRSYRADLQDALERCIVSLRPPIRDGARTLEQARGRLLGAPCQAFVHGDFGPHNIGIGDAGLVLFDFQWACAGPVGWDGGFFMGYFHPEDPALSRVANECLTAAFPALVCAAVKVGRRLRGGRPLGARGVILQGWLEAARGRL